MTDYQEASRSYYLEAEHDRGCHLERPHPDCPTCASYASADFGYTPGEDEDPRLTIIRSRPDYEPA